MLQAFITGFSQSVGLTVIDVESLIVLHIDVVAIGNDRFRIESYSFPLHVPVVALAGRFLKSAVTSGVVVGAVALVDTCVGVAFIQGVGCLLPFRRPGLSCTCDTVDDSIVAVITSRGIPCVPHISIGSLEIRANIFALIGEIDSAAFTVFQACSDGIIASGVCIALYVGRAALTRIMQHGHP